MAGRLQLHAPSRANALGTALQRDMAMEPRDAREIAAIVLAAFDGSDELDDREIDCDLRSVFYELEGHKLLDFRRETYRNEEGYKRRAFYWTIRWDEVEPTDLDEDASTGEEPSVYEGLPSQAWERTART